MNDVDPILSNASFAAAVRARRAALGMTQRELSTSSGVGYESIKRVEGGEQKISVEQIVRLALALNRSPAELVEEATRELVERSVGPSELRDRPASPRSRSRMRI